MEAVGDPLSSSLNPLPSTEETGCIPMNMASGKDDDDINKVEKHDDEGEEPTEDDINGNYNKAKHHKIKKKRTNTKENNIISRRINKKKISTRRKYMIKNKIRNKYIRSINGNIQTNHNMKILIWNKGNSGYWK